MKHILLLVFLMAQSLMAQTIFFKETFDDLNFTQRGWYDNTAIPTTSNEYHGASGMAAEYKFQKGDKNLNGGAIRRLFTPTASLYLSYWVKYSSNYVGSGKPYHPHEFNVTTNLNNAYVGPAWTKMTLYIEQNGGYPMIGFQDGQNIDTNNINGDLTSATESRSCAGCNGSGDAHPAGDCYKSGNYWFNGKLWKSKTRTFADTGVYNKNEWHFVEAYFQLNSISGGKGIADGAAQYWFDGKLLIDAQNVMFRTAANSGMIFNQILIAPYIGDGSPVEQTMWVDDVTVADSRVTTGVGEEYSSRSIEIYPNPADDFLTVELGSDFDKSELVLVDILGNEVVRQRADERLNQLVIPVKQLMNGVYMLRLQTHSGISTQRVIVNR